MEGEKRRELAALREAGLTRDPNWKPWRDPVFTERLYREEDAPGSAGQNGAHTPGPWRYFSNSAGVGVTSSQADVAHCHGLHCERKRPEVEANARLIAAAPQMLDALGLVSDRLPNFPDPDAVEEDDIAEVSISLADWRTIRQAIAAATGEAV